MAAAGAQRVKCFKAATLDDIEAAVNKWLRNNTDVTVYETQIAVYVRLDGYVMHVAVIRYLPAA